MNICVIGASQGLGRALCQELLSRGHHVWAAARREQPLATLPRAEHAPYFWSRADMTQEGDLRAMQKQMQERGFVPDAIVLTAGVQQDDMEGAYDHTRGEKVIATNLNGSLACVQVFLPEFLLRRSGSFVAIASTSALRPSRRSASYAASKAGLAMAFRSFRARYSKDGVRFKTVYLGPIQTSMWEGKSRWLVPGASRAAKRIASFITSSSSLLYYPTLSTTLLRVSLWIPDRVFSALSTFLLK